MAEDEEFDLSDWTVVDEDISDGVNSSRKSHTEARTHSRRYSSDVRRLDQNAKRKSGNKPDNRSATSTRNQSSKQTSNKTDVVSKDVAKSVTSTGARDAGKNETQPVVSSSKVKTSSSVVESEVSSCIGEASKNESLTSVSTAGSDKNNEESTSENAAPTGESCETCTGSPPGGKVTEDSTTPSGCGATKIPSSENVQSTPPKDAPVELPSLSDVASVSQSISGQLDLPVVTQASSLDTSSSTASSVPLKEDAAEAVSSELSISQLTSLVPPSSVLSSTEKKNTDEGVISSQEATVDSESTPLSTHPAVKPAVSAVGMTPVTSTVSSANNLAVQTASSRPLMKSNTHMKGKFVDVDSIAEIMAAVGKEDANITHFDGVEEVSDTELTDTMDVANSEGTKSQKSKAAGAKRDASPNKGGPAIKKAKVQYSKSSSGSAQVSGASAARDTPAGCAAKKDSVPSDQDSGSQNKKSPKQQNHCNKAEDNIKAARSQVPGGMSSTPKGSFGAAKAPVTKTKTPPAALPVSNKTTTASAAAKTNEVGNKPGTSTSTTVKRIIRRFHRMTQTVPTEYSNKLVQCLIKIPSLDAPPKSNCHSEVQVAIEKAKDEVFYQKALPDTVRPEIFKVVSAFDVDAPGSRNITTGPYGYGISFGHITAADMEKSLFRENLLAKSAYYNVSFNRQDCGVVDLFFGEEEHFVTVLTHIRKMRIGQRHLVVTYCKNLKENERAPECPVSSAKATIIYNQNFATTDFIANSKAPLWNRPKVEELLTIHNMPEGIPLDFLKLIIPDALSVELDDKKQKFTQKGSHVHLGLDRKKGADSFMKLFTQMYINNECLAFSTFGSPISSVPELAEILQEKKSRENEMKNVRELKAVSRDINATPYVGEKEEVEVIMKVETEASVKKILSSAPGPSTVQKQQQPGGPPESSKAPVVGSSKNPAFSDVSDELSDISDTSDIGVEAAVPKTSQKTATAVPKTSQKTATSPAQKKSTPLVYKTSRVQHLLPTTRPTEKKGSKNESPTSASKNTVRKTSGFTSKASERRKETRDRLLDKNRKSSLSKPLDKSIRPIRSSRPYSHDVRKERHDRVGHVSSSDGGKEQPTHRLSNSGSRVRDEPEASRDRSRRDRPHVESARRGSYDKVSSHRDHGINAGGRGRHAGGRGRRGHSSSRTERTRNKSEERDNVKLRVTPTVDRHGNKIANFRDSREFIRKTHGSQENESEQFYQSKTGRSDAYPERDSRRGNPLDILLQKRLGSLERQEREADDSRQVILTRSRSPITRRVYRGRSASPRKHQSMSVRVRQTSPSAVYASQQRLLALRRSRSPRQTSHSSVLSPISAGEDEADDAQEGVWLPQPPVTLDSRQDLRTSTRSTGYTRPQAEWKSQISSDESEKEAFAESQSARFIEQFVQEMIGTGRASARSATPSEKLPPTAVHDPATVIEKIREIYNSSLKINDHVSDNDNDEILNPAVRRGSRSRSRPAERVEPVSSRNTARLPSNISSGSSNMDLEPVDRFGNRDDYGRHSEGTGDVGRFDSPVNSRSQVVGREPLTIPSQTHSREFLESRISDKRNSTGYSESRESDKLDSRRYPESRISDQPNSKGYAESRVSDQPNSRRYVDSRVSDEPNSRRYVDSRISDEPKSRGFAESRVSDQPSSKAYAESRVSDQPNSRRYMDSRFPDQLNSRGYTESRVSDPPTSEAYAESRVSDQPNSRGFAESRIADQTNASRYREPGMTNYSTFEGHQESGLQGQSNYGQSREPELPNWPDSGRYSEFGMHNSGGYREPETPYQQTSEGFRESEAPNHPVAGVYHQNQNQPLPPPILPAVVTPTLYNSGQSAQEQLAELENMAQMLAAGMGQHQGQPPSDSTPEMWNTPSQQASAPGPQSYSAGPQLYTQGPQTYTSGPQQYSAGPQLYSTGPPFQFSGPQHPQGPNMNFTGPPIQPNINQQFVRGANPQPGPWPPSNFF